MNARPEEPADPWRPALLAILAAASAGEAGGIYRLVAGQPGTDLGAFLREWPPEALVLSCAMATALPGARECIREAHRAGVPVLAGGSSFSPDGARALLLGADA